MVQWVGNLPHLTQVHWYSVNTLIAFFRLRLDSLPQQICLWLWGTVLLIITVRGLKKSWKKLTILRFFKKGQVKKLY